MSSQLYKYSRTPHLSFSPGVGKDDLKLNSDRIFSDRHVIVTEKLDGENTTLYPDYIHARSLDSCHHSSRTWVKALQASISNDIPPGWRICGETAIRLCRNLWFICKRISCLASFWRRISRLAGLF